MEKATAGPKRKPIEGIPIASLDAVDEDAVEDVVLGVAMGDVGE